ncbi:MAG: 7,8-didemethyl-8-hydroxy-5-deazariboflavin synthase subunit CofG [Candidatus Helarchaeota archaeon]
MDQIKPTLSSELQELFIKRLESKIRNKDDLLKIYQLKVPDLIIAMAYSNLLYRKYNNGVISYSINVFIPLTSYCRNLCKYCNFRTDYNEKMPIYILPNQVKSIIKIAEENGCKEALLTMGEKPEEKYPQVKKYLKDLGNYETTIDYLIDICKLILDNSGLLPHSNPGIMSYDELKRLKEVNASLGLMLENISHRLMDEDGPHEFSPGKNPKLRLETIENAGKLKIPFTTGILIGIGETYDEIIESLLKIDEINTKYGHIQEIIIQGYAPSTDNKNNPPYKPPSIIKMIKTIIVAKLITDIPIQTPPNLYRSFQSILLTGIDDWGGISPVSPDYINPAHPWPLIEEIYEKTIETGFSLRERLPIYPKFLSNKKISNEYISEKLRKRIFNLIDETGYVK